MGLGPKVVTGGAPPCPYCGGGLGCGCDYDNAETDVEREKLLGEVRG